jgi:hypothetical protein
MQRRCDCFTAKAPRREVLLKLIIKLSERTSSFTHVCCLCIRSLESHQQFLRVFT